MTMKYLSIEELKKDVKRRYIITISGEYYDTEDKEFLNIKQIIGRLNKLTSDNEKLKNKIKDKNTYQRTLENKITRLKKRITLLEKKNKKNKKKGI